MNKWEMLREHAEKQERNYKESNSIGKLGAHIWKDVQNKMWSLDKASLNQSNKKVRE